MLNIYPIKESYQAPVVGRPFDAVRVGNRVFFADLDCEVQRALQDLVFRPDLVTDANRQEAVPVGVVSFQALAPQRQDEVLALVYDDQHFEAFPKKVRNGLLRFVFGEDSPCEWSEEAVTCLHCAALKHIASLADPETPLAERFDLIRWIFTDRDDEPFSFVSCVMVAATSPLSPWPFVGKCDVEELRDWLRHQAKRWFLDAIKNYLEAVRREILLNTEAVAAQVERNPQWLNEQMRKHWGSRDEANIQPTLI